MRTPVPLDDTRIHAVGEPPPTRGAFVLYWMQMTQRAHHNFALNFAIAQGNALGLPVAAVFRLRDDYPWASDRFHTFILQGLAGMGDRMAARGVTWGLLHESRPGSDGGVLAAIAARAALVVTDHFPTFIAPRQTRELRRLDAVPVVAVDSATVVPMGMHDRAWAAASGMRNALREAKAHYLRPVDDTAVARVRTGVDLASLAAGALLTPLEDAAAIARFVAGTAVDHAVPPAPIEGGTDAGRRRLEQWLRNGIERYADERNDPNADATSRLSPWLHFGHLSPHEVLLAARDAASADAWAAFEDECLTWRELAYNFAHFDPRHRTVAAIPPWARRELAEHERDARDALYDRDTLERAETGSELWNACQRAYLADGWMHNYLRMLWGKAVIGWTPDAATALGILEHLNNRWALDGRDPCTYAGIHWCFGKFDRPFYRRPVFGTVRYMSLRAAGKKFDVPRYIGEQAGRLGAS